MMVDADLARQRATTLTATPEKKARESGHTFLRP